MALILKNLGFYRVLFSFGISLNRLFADIDGSCCFDCLKNEELYFASFAKLLFALCWTCNIQVKFLWFFPDPFGVHNSLGEPNVLKFCSCDLALLRCMFARALSQENVNLAYLRVLNMKCNLYKNILRAQVF